MTTPEPFETETMAELHARQGRPAEALSIIQRLAESHPHHRDRPRWQRWMDELRVQVTDMGDLSDLPVLPEHLAIPRAPGVTAIAGRNAHGGTEAAVAWALPATPGPPVLEVLLVLRDAAGIDTVRRQIPVNASSGRISLPTDRLFAAAAAAGYRDADDRFIPVARSTAS